MNKLYYRNGKRRVMYALYYGDTFIKIGTREEIAEHEKVNEQTISIWATPKYVNQENPNIKRVINIGYVEEDDYV